MVHDVHGLNIKSFSHLYNESRSLNLSAIRLFGNSRVWHALDLKEKREDEWVQKFSSAIFTKGLIGEVVPPIVHNLALTDNASLDDSLTQPLPPPRGTLQTFVIRIFCGIGFDWSFS